MFQVGDIVQVIIVPKKYKQYDITGATGIVKTVYSNNIRIHISSYYNEKSEEGDFYFKENELDNFARKENDMSIIELWEKRSIEKIDKETEIKLMELLAEDEYTHDLILHMNDLKDARFKVEMPNNIYDMTSDYTRGMRTITLSSAEEKKAKIKKVVEEIGAISTEHAVMASNYAVDGDEITFVKRLLTELYPNASFSMVSDTYDYWNMIDNILPACKKEIMQHNGKLLVRPDSGDMVEISVKTIEKLWNTFEGSVNSKGYKVLDPHIGIIYGDGCTLNNVKKVWEELEKKGFAANNIVFGVGAFCFSAVVEPDGRMVVVTRDMFGIAMKATFGEVNGQPIMIYKDPKTDVSHLKKSHKGCCHVYYDENGELRCRDGYDSFVYDGALKTVFKDGEMCYVETFKKIRNRLNGGN